MNENSVIKIFTTLAYYQYTYTDNRHKRRLYKWVVYFVFTLFFCIMVFMDRG